MARYAKEVAEIYELADTETTHALALKQDSLIHIEKLKYFQQHIKHSFVNRKFAV